MQIVRQVFSYTKRAEPSSSASIGFKRYSFEMLLWPLKDHSWKRETQHLLAKYIRFSEFPVFKTRHCKPGLGVILSLTSFQVILFRLKFPPFLIEQLERESRSTVSSSFGPSPNLQLISHFWAPVTTKLKIILSLSIVDRRVHAVKLPVHSCN